MVNCGLIFSIAIIAAVHFGLSPREYQDVYPALEYLIADHLSARPVSDHSRVTININDITQLSSSPIDDPPSVWKLQLELLAIAEALFGPRDSSYQLYQPQFYENGPNVRFSLDRKGVWAELSYNGRFYWPTVLYELAHETVHLLNPGVLGTANNLEEGVAVAFSIYVQQAYGVEIQRPSIPSYVYALSLVEALPNNPLTSAGRIRRELGRFSNVSKDDLVNLFPELDVDVANHLTDRFKR